MKQIRRWAVYGLLAVALVLSGELPFQNRDVGKLLPVETSLLYIDRGQVVIETDQGLRGRGATWALAVKDLEAKAAGVVFYDTGNYLLLHESAVSLLKDLPGREKLRDSCALCLVDWREADLAAAGKYLSAHKPKVNLRRIQAAQAVGEPVNLPKLIKTEGAFLLVPGEN